MFFLEGTTAIVSLHCRQAPPAVCLRPSTLAALITARRGSVCAGRNRRIRYPPAPRIASGPGGSRSGRSPIVAVRFRFGLDLSFACRALERQSPRTPLPASRVDSAVGYTGSLTLGVAFVITDIAILRSQPGSKKGYAEGCALGPSIAGDSGPRAPIG